MNSMHRVLLVLAAVWMMGGCASSPQEAADPFGAAPEDFSIDVTVLRGGGGRGWRESPASAVHLRPARYVMLADGSLYTGEVVEYAAADQLPWLTRRLSREQVAGLWSYLKQSGLGDPAIGNQAPNANLLEPESGELVYALMFTGAGDRWSVLRRTFDDADVDAPTAELIRRLARLSWRSDDPNRARMMAPRRYDFGPDPYARYRGGDWPSGGSE